MKKISFILIVFLIISSCSHKKKIVYLNDVDINNLNKINYSLSDAIQVGDILKIDVTTLIPELSKPYRS